MFFLFRVIFCSLLRRLHVEHVRHYSLEREWEVRELPANTHPPSNIRRAESRVAEGDSWDRGACRSGGTSDSGSRPCPADRSFQGLRRLCRNCRARGIASNQHLSLHPAGNPACGYGAASPLFFGHRHRTSLSLVGLQYLLAQPQRFGSDLDKLVVGDKFNRLLKIQISKWHQSNRYVRGG